MSLLERPNPVNWWYILYLNSLRLSQNFFRQFTPYTYLKTKILLKDIQNSWKIWLGLDRSIKRGKCISWKENVARVAIITSFFFFKITDDGYSFRVQWYGDKNEIICGHVETSKNDDKCAKCHGSCNEGEEWLCCPACHQWYHEDCFLWVNLSHPVLSLDYITY